MKIIEYTIKQADYKKLIDSITKEFDFKCSYTKNNLSIYFKETTIGNFNFCYTIIFDYTEDNQLEVVIVYAGGKATLLLKEDIYGKNLRNKITKFIKDFCKKNNWIIIEKTY